MCGVCGKPHAECDARTGPRASDDLVRLVRETATATLLDGSIPAWDSTDQRSFALGVGVGVGELSDRLIRALSGEWACICGHEIERHECASCIGPCASTPSYAVLREENERLRSLTEWGRVCKCDTAHDYRCPASQSRVGESGEPTR